MSYPPTPTDPSTITARLGQTAGTVIRMAAEHTRAVQSWLPTRAPGSARFQGQGIQAGSTGYQIGLLNLALDARFPPGTGPETVDAEIADLKAFFAGRGVPWGWWIGPDPRPPNILDHLDGHALRLRTLLPCMVAPLPKSGWSLDLPPKRPYLHTWQARTVADLQAASQIRCQAFRFPAGTAEDYFEAAAEDWLRGDPARLFLASFNDGPPRAIGALIMGNGTPGVYIMATQPGWGRRGLGSAILHRLFHEAMAGGHSLITLTAGRRGYPLYVQFGFIPVFNYHVVVPNDP